MNIDSRQRRKMSSSTSNAYIVLGLFAIIYTLINELELLPRAEHVNKASPMLRQSSPVTYIPRLNGAPDGPIAGTRILIAIPSYGQKQFLYLQDMVDSLHDLCETGAKVTVFIYTTEPYSIEQISLFNSQTTCYHPTGTMDIQVKIKPPSLKLHFVDAHRQDFYENINKFDLFIYTEDDHHIRPTHVIGYLHETEKLKEIVGEKAFPNYSIGFLRYERDHNEVKRFTFDQYAYKGAGLHAFENPALKDKYIGNTRMPHQGMFMATPEQLSLWRDRCQFDIIDPQNVERVAEKGTPTWHREYVSSLRLFINEGVKKNCEVTQLFPVDTFEYFMVHHMPDKYYTNPKFDKQYSLSAEDLHGLVLKMVDAKENEEVHTKKNKDGNYDGVTMEIAPEYEEAMKKANEPIPEAVSRDMKKYEEFVKNGGRLIGGN